MSATGTLLVYGSYGYTGRLVVEEAVDRGLEPVLAGRDADEVAARAAEHGLEGRPFSLRGDPAARLGDVDCVLNCAGPFVETAEPLADACLERGTDYLDIAGEVPVLEALAGRDAAAREAGVAVLPGVGFDVVPTDCLAAHLTEALPGATHLRLGFDDLGPLSRGTALSMVDRLGEGGAVREDGELRRVPPAFRSRRVDFGDGRGPRRAVTVPWGDVATAMRTTGVPNVECYAAVPPAVALAMRASAPFEWVFDLPAVEASLKSAVRATVTGPDERERREGRTHVWGEVTDGEATRVARLRTPNVYALTARTAVESARRAAAEGLEPGYLTPAGGFGADYVLEFEGVSRQDAHAPEAEDRPVRIAVGDPADEAGDDRGGSASVDGAESQNCDGVGPENGDREAPGGDDEDGAGRDADGYPLED